MARRTLLDTIREAHVVGGLGEGWVLKHSGIRRVIAPSIGDIFAGNRFQSFVLPVVQPADQVRRLAGRCAGGNARVTVDLQRRVVVPPHGEETPFAVEAIRREALIEGSDEIGLTPRQEALIAAFQARDRAGRPWVWQPGAGGRA